MKTLPFLVLILTTALVEVIRAAPGNLDPLDAQVTGSYTMASVPQADGAIILAGRFTQVKGVARNNIARLNGDGTLDAGFDPNANDDVRSLALLPDGKILIGGNFTTIAGVSRSRIARLLPNGSLDAAFAASVDNGILRVLALQPDGKILLGGSFSSISGVTRNRIARLNADGTLDTGFNPGADGEVRSLVLQPDGKVVLGGLFTARIARVNSAGVYDSGFTASVTNSSVDCLALQPDGKLIFGGNYTNSAGRIGRLNPNGSRDTPFAPSINDRINGLGVQVDGKILLSGEFTSVAGITRNRFARLNADGTLDATFNPNSGGIGYGTMIQADGRILASGAFTTLQPNGGSLASRIGFARLLNDPASQTLTVTNPERILWSRSGAGPEFSMVAFDVSIDGGFNWSVLGNGVRIGTTADWELTGLSLPSNGLLRARGWVGGGLYNGSNGLAEQTSAYNLVHNLAWDPGDESGGTEAYSTTYSNGGQYVFRVVTQNTNFDAWRAALKVISGEANLYWKLGSIPTTTSFDGSSTLAGSDGFVKQLSTSSGAGQVWYFLVDATVGSSWSFLAGDVHVEDLGELSSDATSSSAVAPIGPEGARFFRTSIPSDTLAWRLWVNDGTNATVPANVYTRRNLVGQPHPFPKGLSEMEFVGQDLLVPGSSPSSHEFVAGSGEPYFVSVYAAPGTSVALDNRKQSVADIPYQHTTGVVSASGYHYYTYRVEVPVEQIAWEATSIRETGDPDLAVRRNEVPNGRINEFESEVVGSASDSITVVPNILTEGTYLITVHADADFSFRLFNGEPEITAIPFEGSVTNTDTDRVGWRFFSISGEDQIGQFGWALSLTGHVLGTEIFTRRNAVPGKENGLYALRSGSGVLQEPGHQADYWYVGVYLPTAALGSFTLHSGPINPPTVTMNGGTHTTASLPPQQWDFVRVDVPAQVGGENVLGWELRVKNWSGGSPQMVVRRAMLPDQLYDRMASGNTVWYPWLAQDFPSGQQHFSGGDQWTSRSNASGTDEGVDRVLSLAMGNPLEPGTYYIGVYNQGPANCAFTFQSRAIGKGMSLDVVDASVGSPVNISGLAPREPKFFKYVLPTATPNWQFKLGIGAATSDGEGMLVLRKDFLPNSQWGVDYRSAPYATDSGALTHPCGLRIAGDERLTMLPLNGQTTLPAGTYYAMVISEGRPVPDTGHIGSEAVDFTLENTTPVPVENLGTVSSGTITKRADSLLSGENRFFRFTVPANALALSITLNDQPGTSVAYLKSAATGLPHDYLHDYGLVGGEYATHQVYNQGTVTISSPAAGDYYLLVRDQSGVTASAFDLEIEVEGAQTVTFDGGTKNETALAPNRWRYYQVTVPVQVGGENVLGWELRVKNWSGGNPHLVVRRGLPPDQVSDASSSGGNLSPGSATNFPVGQQHFTSGDQWTGRYEASGADGEHRVLSLAVGNPLEPGTYYIGVKNVDTTESCAFTLQSRAIGKGMSLNVQDASVGSPVSVNGLDPREPAYFRYVVPTPIPSWQFQLGFGADTLNGEGMLVLREGWIPNSQRGGSGSTMPYRYSPGLTDQCVMKIAGMERVSLLPAAGETMIPAGTYYAMVVSEGRAVPGTSQIGTGAVNFVLENSTPVAVENVGEVAFGSPVVRAGSLLTGENRFLRFSLPVGTLALAITSAQGDGNPLVTLRKASSGLPRGWPQRSYGLVGGEPEDHAISEGNSLTLSSPQAGEYLMLIGDTYGPQTSTYDVRIETQGAESLTFDGGEDVVGSLAGQRWQYYLVTVPAQSGGEDVLGWELRVKNWTGGDPQMVVRRDLPPDQAADIGVSASSTAFPSGSQLYTYRDPWTYRSEPGNADGEHRILSLSMGNPLEPGTYYIGVKNMDTTESCTFTLQSRAIGEGMSLNVQDASVGSPVVFNGLAPREPAYFRYVVPAPIPSWQFQLGFGAGTPDGEGMLVLREGWVPNSQRGGYGITMPYRYSPGLTDQCVMNIAGMERVSLLPEAGQTMIPAGTYYAMVVSEGRAVPNTSQIGSGPVNLILENSTPVLVEELGSVSTGTPITDTSLVVQGGAQFYRYSVANSTWPMEIRHSGLNGTNSLAFLRTLDGKPTAPKYPYSYYGVAGGEYANAAIISSNSVYTMASPPVGQHALTIQSNSPTTTGAEFQVSIIQKTPRPMAFSSQLAGAVSNTQSFNLLNGQYEFYEMTMPPAISGQVFLGWLLRVQTTTGTAYVTARKDQLPLAGGGTFETGSSNGWLYVGQQFRDASNTPVNLLPGTWYVQLQASGVAQGTVTSEAIFATALNFDQSQNGGGGSHVATGQLGTGEKKFYVVTVPGTLNGEEVIAWNLRLEESSGNASVRVSPGTLPISYGATIHNDHGNEDDLLLDRISVPPGTYYVEVEGNSATEYTLTSDALTSSDIDRSWEMPVRGGPVTTPGLTMDPEDPSKFGDSGILANGNPVSNPQQGIDIAAGGFDFYTIIVPEGNEGILRAQLDAISGNPDLYIRRGALRSEAGFHDYGLTQSVNTEFGNWVASDAKVSKQLPPGVYYLVVEAASGTNARYRLRLSAGRVQDLAMDGGMAVDVDMVGGDWRYFRVEVPLDLPQNWQVGYSLAYGAGEFFVRDSVPPGSAGPSPTSDFRSWATDQKNQGSYTSYSSPTTVTFSPPQVRPGHTYYLGFRSTTDSTITVTSQTGGTLRSDPPLLDFTNGTVTDTLAAGEKRYFRIPVPVGASRWKHAALHASSVSLYLEQGSFPSETPFDDWYSGGVGNSFLNQTMTGTWPWVGGESYYLAVVNTSATNQAFTFTMNGESVLADVDNDGIPDVWENQYLSGIGYDGTSDALDRDGTPLLLEHFFGLDPTKADVPEIIASRDGGDFVIEFRKLRETPLVSYAVQWNLGLEPEEWTQAPASFGKLSDEGNHERWRARIPGGAAGSARFFRISVVPIP